MPYALNRGVRIYWEEHGSGEPVVLVMGLSFTLEMWFRVTPVLARSYRVILFDNRGVGRSDAPRGPYRIPAMAEDSFAVMEAAGVNEPAFLVGASMGGMIAQEMALRSPERFRGLVLGCTACGGVLHGAWPDVRYMPGLWGWLTKRGEERENMLTPLLYSASTPRERIEEDVRVRATRQPPIASVLNQFAGVMLWQSLNRLPQLNLPTLVVHGEEDRVLPIENGRMVAARIPDAEFVAIPRAGHILITDQPEVSLEAMERFLSETAAAARPAG